MRILFFFGFVLCLFSCGEQEKKQDILFELVHSEKSNIDFINQVENEEHFNFLEYLYFYNGGGVAIGDINNDGLPDVFFTSNQNDNKLYLNKGDFIFQDITTTARVKGSGDWTTGVTMADVNADGLLDIYVCNVGGYKGLKGKNELYINNGDLTFTENASDYGLDFSGFATQAIFFDYDQDTDLDVYLLNHSVHSVGSYGDATLRFQLDAASGDKLLQSQLAQGTMMYRDVTKEAGIFQSKIGYGLGVAVADINEDGWPDIYVGNDFHENDYLYINNGDGTFKESLETMLGHSSRYSMGNDIGDINNDGLLDIITTDMLPKSPSILMKSGAEDKLEVSDIKLRLGYGHQLARNALQLNRGNGQFSDIALFAGMFATDWSWSPLIADFDNDGYKDIHITNGIFKRPNDMDYIQYISNLEDFRFNPKNQKNIDEEMLKRMPTLQIPNEAFKYEGNLKWTPVSSAWGLDQASYSNGSAYADLDNDGDLDLVINNVNQPAFVYRNKSNEASVKNNFVKISLKGAGQNVFALGARVNIRAHGQLISNSLMASRGFQSSVEPVLTIGLGTISNIDTLEIFWPSGKFQRMVNMAVNQHFHLSEPEASEAKQIPDGKKWLAEVNGLLKYKHNENITYKDNDMEYLIPYRLSALGPPMSTATVDRASVVYVGGAAGQSGAMFVQKPDGKFEQSIQEAFERDRLFEDVASGFVDLDNDDDLDLIVLSGGYQYPEGHPLLQDRIYINQNGKLIRSSALADLRWNSSCLAVADFDNDGDKDILIGSNSIKGNYGKSSGGALFINDGGGNFSDKTKTLAPQLKNMGMITSATWLDVDNDKDLDLVVAGHWMPITILVNESGGFSKTIEINNSSGFWNAIVAADIDSDGDLDIVAGNIGLNNKFIAVESHPLKLYVTDFDDNGTSDPMIMKFQDGRYIPLFTKDEIEKQTVVIKKKYTTYKAYADQVNGIGDLFSEDKVNQALKREVMETRSMYFVNEGDGVFHAEALPTQMQLSPINSIIVDDLNNDKIPDIITAGNNLFMHINPGRLDSDFGSVAFGEGNGKFKYIKNATSGLNLNGQVNAAGTVVVNNKKYFVFALNNDSIKVYVIQSYEK